MSAYMCSQKQLTALAAYAVKHCLAAIPWRHRAGVDSDGFEHRPSDYNRTISRVFSMLVSENLASLHCRYPEDAKGDPEAYVLDEKALQTTLPALHMIKLCHHYAYQSCEHSGWQSSDARKLIDAIESHAVHNLPGYTDAPWGI